MSQLSIVKEMMRQRVWKMAAPAQLPLVRNLPLPDALDTVEITPVTPVPRLELMVASVRLKSNYFWHLSDAGGRKAFPLPVARLSFDYCGEIVPSTSPMQMLERADGDRMILTPRDMPAEQKASKRLAGLSLKPLDKLPFDVPRQHAGDFTIASGARS